MRLSERIIFEDMLPKKIRFVAGADVAYAERMSIGAAVVLDFNSLKLMETQTVISETRLPYIPTLLSFREIPPVLSSIKKLRTQPDAILVDGQGFAHPYRCGFASHLGLALSKPTIGVAKSKLIGEVEEYKSPKDVVFLKDKSQVIGAMVRTKQNCKPVYVSVGHMISLETAIKIVKHCTRDNRVPEPILKAHKLATLEKEKFNIGLETNR